MLAAFAAATFVVTSSGSATAPFMQVIAADLATDLPAVAHLFSVQAATWGTASLVAGTLSDRLGRRPILIGAVVLLGVTRLGFSASGDYATVLAWQLVSGIGGGAFMGTVFAAVSDNIPAGARGRALSWIITGQSLSLVLGVPLVTLLGTMGGWRGAIAAHGCATLLAAAAVYFATPPDVRRAPLEHAHKASLRVLLQPQFAALLAAGTTERMCFAALAIYLPTFLQRSYGVAFAPLAIALALVALGGLAGNLTGGRIADSSRSRMRVYAAASLATAALALPTLLWHPSLALSVALGFAYAFVNACGRPALLATLSEVPSELRGALFGLNVTMASMGWLLAGSVGALLMVRSGFVGIGVLCAGMALAGALLALVAGRAARARPLLPHAARR